jgi:hypothetical protein
MRMIPFVFAIAGLTALVTELDKGADESAKLREEVYRTARATRDLTDANGNLTQSTINAAKQGRFYRGVTTELNAAISATVGAAVAAGNAMSGNLTPNTYDAGDAADKASKSYFELYQNIWETRRAAAGLAQTSGTVSSAIGQGFTKRFLDGVGSLASTYGEADKAASGAGKSAKEAKDKFVSLADVLPGLIELTREYGLQLDPTSKIANAPKLIERLRDSFTRASDAVRDAQSEYDGFRDSVYSTISGYLSLSNAADAYYGRQKAVTDALNELTAYRARLTDDATDNEKLQLADLQKAYQDAQTAAAQGAQSVVEEFVQQSEKFGEFGRKMQELLRRGLNKTSFMQILEMGAERGGDVADAYLKGNTQALIDQTNSTMKAYDELAQQIAKESADAFYRAGIESALAIVKALAAVLGKDGLGRKQLRNLIRDLENDLRINIGANVTVGGGGGGGGGGSLVTPQGLQVPIPVGFSPSAASDFIDGILMGGAIPFAKGGIVTSPTLGLVGEAGPEAIIPLNRGGVGTTINLTVNAGMGTDGGDVGRQIVDALRQYERRNGPVPITVR